MNKHLSKISRKTIGTTLSLLSKSKATLSFWNNIYEGLPARVLRKIEPFMPTPSFDFRWHIKLKSKTVFFTYKKGEERIIYHFPLSYKKNDYGIRKLEEILNEYYPKDICYFDIGANFGLRSIYYSSMGRQCFLFEPNKKCNDVTRRFAAENGIDNITVISKIIGNTNCIQKFHISKNTYLSSVNIEHSKNYDDFLETIEEEQIRIDDFVVENNLVNKVRLLKIDVEGFEYPVLLGANELLKSPGITLTIEVLEDAKDRQKIFDLLAGLNFEVFSILPDDNKINLQKAINQFDLETIDFICTNDKTLARILSGYIGKDV